jgi:glycosyltransferase involved in cell wall biosynthesis
MAGRAPSQTHARAELTDALGEGLPFSRRPWSSLQESTIEQVPAVRLTRDKRVPELLLSFDMLLQSEPAARLMLVGRYDESEDALPTELRASIDRHPQIVLTGFVSDTAPWYRAMDMLVLPTRREGFPNVALEAAASGIPVITTLATGARDSVLNGVTGLLIPPRRPEAITQAILQLLDNPENRRQMGAAARKWVIQRFLQTRVHALNVALYVDLLQTGRRLDLPVPARGAAAAD